MIELHITDNQSVLDMSRTIDAIHPKLLEVTTVADGICLRFYQDEDADGYVAEVLVPRDVDTALKRFAIWKATVCLFFA